MGFNDNFLMLYIYMYVYVYLYLLSQKGAQYGVSSLHTCLLLLEVQEEMCAMRLIIALSYNRKMRKTVE